MQPQDKTDRVPVVTAMVLCDDILQDQESGKKTLVGLFDQIRLLRVPAVHRMAVYAHLIEGAGPHVFRLAVEAPGSGAEAAAIRMEPVQITGHMHAVDLVFRLNVPLNVAGRYETKLFANDRLLFRVSFSVLEPVPAEASVQLH